MKRRASRALTALLAVIGSILLSVVVTGTAGADTTICEKYGGVSIAGGKYHVINNVWGSDAQQCINVTSTGFRVTQAGHNKATNGAPASYPAIYAGCHYATCTSGSSLPMRVSDSRFSSIQTSVSMSYPSSGVYDAAYDIWFDPTPRTDGQNTGAELMIWLNRVGSIQPIGSRVATVNLAGGTWDVWFGNVGWNVVSYVRTSATNSISFNVGTFYSDMVNRGYAQNSWYITSVQAGFEPWVGGAGLAVDNFSYNVGGGGNPGPSPSPSNPGNPGGSSACRVKYTKSQWSGGFTADLAITNTGSGSINGWTLGFSFPNDQRITNAWNATVSQNGSAVTARNVDHNGSIPPGGTASFGFQGTFGSTNNNPGSFTLNGTACSLG
ncbi:glycosyl hydrolase family 5 [Sphaerisporangium rufum]|uniref:Glycosyl hydrolase family 5 n=1 Tax=Sphaerisporangium rufum TaxID=1381558 RepID=A0A919V3Q7_9ACTN|nr:cellulose binding domain-containing protein [Sphaerisporangium rufum]GII80353.1 glycosyl hydrolase family 5 [Sphaerisporangium rufum]